MFHMTGRRRVKPLWIIKPLREASDVARAAIELSMTQSRDEEQRWRQTLRQQGVIGAAADFGGDFLTGIVRIVERAVVAPSASR